VELYVYSPNTPSWRGAQLGGAQGQLHLYIYIYIHTKYICIIFFICTHIYINNVSLFTKRKDLHKVASLSQASNMSVLKMDA